MLCQENMPKNIQIMHVRGHQADEESENLPLEVNLNIRADKIANQQQMSAQTHQDPEDPILTTTMNGQIITSKPIIAMRHLIAKQRLQTYMESKLNDQALKVDWTSLEKSINTFKRLPTSLTKLIHNATPTQAHMCKIQLTNCDKCPCCKVEIESIHHVIKCEAREMDGFKIFYTTIKDKLKTAHVPERLMNQIYMTIVSSENQIEGFTSPAQQLIGWHKLLQGYFSLDWSEFFKTLPGNTPGNTYVENIITAIWKTWHQAWTIRNASIDDTFRYKQQMVRDNLICELETIYVNRGRLCQKTSALLEETLQQHLIHPQNNIANWLEMHKQQCKEEINKGNPHQWNTTREAIISREMEKFNDPV